MVFNFQSIRILKLAIVFNFCVVSISTKKKIQVWRNMAKNNHSKGINSHLSQSYEIMKTIEKLKIIFSLFHSWNSNNKKPKFYGNIKRRCYKKNFVFVSSQFKEKTNSNFQVKSIQQKVVNEVKRSEGNKVSASLSSQVLRIVFVVDSSVDNINNSDTDIHLDNI